MSSERSIPVQASTEWTPGWEQHELDQLRRMAKLTLAEKLEWLEEAHALIHRLARARETAASSRREPNSR